MRMLRATKFTLSSSCILSVAMKWKLLSHVWLYNLMDSPGQHSGVGSCSLLQGIFATQGSNPGRPHSLPSEVDSLPSEPPGELLLVAEPRPKPGSFHFSVAFFFVLYSHTSTALISKLLTLSYPLPFLPSRWTLLLCFLLLLRNIDIISTPYKDCCCCC